MNKNYPVKDSCGFMCYFNVGVDEITPILDVLRGLYDDVELRTYVAEDKIMLVKIEDKITFIHSDLAN